MRSPAKKKASSAVARPSKVVLDRYVPYQLRLLSEAYSLGLARTLQRRFDLPLREWRVLFHIGAEAPMSVTQIAVRSVIDKGSASRAVANLIDRGYVKRRKLQGKARRADLYLSTRGERVYREIMPLMLAREARLLSPLDDAERKQFLRAIKMLLGQVWAANAGTLDPDLDDEGDAS